MVDRDHQGRHSKGLIMLPLSKQLDSVGYRVLPLHHRVWRWEVYSRKDDRLLEAGQLIGSKAKAIITATSAARIWENKNPNPKS
jgi:hypothetical protein